MLKLHKGVFNISEKKLELGPGCSGDAAENLELWASMWELAPRKISGAHVPRKKREEGESMEVRRLKGQKGAQ